MASASESYKSIISFGKNRKQSLWTRWMEKSVGREPLYEKAKVLERRLIEYGDLHIDKDVRDLTLHYDDNMLKVYRLTLKVLDLNKVIGDVVEYLNLLRDIKNLLNGWVYKDWSRPLDGASKRIESLLADTVNKTLRDCWAKDGRLRDAIDSTLKKNAKFLDTIASGLEKKSRLENLLETKDWLAPKGIEILEELTILSNMELLLYFFATDTACVMQAYMNSTVAGEMKMNLRRLVWTKTSTLSHLYGYEEKEMGKSLWQRVKSIIPVDEFEMRVELETIGDELRAMVANSDDKRSRALFVHPVDKKVSDFSLPRVIDAIDAIFAHEELFSMLDLLSMVGRLTKLVNRLLVVLSEKHHAAGVKTSHDMLEKLAVYRAKMVLCPMPESTKKKLLASMHRFEQMVYDCMLSR
jgi:hypothetical protein